MSAELEDKIRDRVVKSLDSPLTKIAKHIEILCCKDRGGGPYC